MTKLDDPADDDPDFEDIGITRPDTQPNPTNWTMDVSKMSLLGNIDVKSLQYPTIDVNKMNLAGLSTLIKKKNED